jgi:phosphate-selective porin OprO/OprP
MKVLPLLLVTVSLEATPSISRSQEQTEAPSNPTSEEAQTTPAQTTPAQTIPGQTQVRPPPNLENTVEVVEPLPRRDLVHWNEYQCRISPFGPAAFLYYFAALAQDKESKEQSPCCPGEKVRDFRFIMGGRLRSLLLNTTWCAGACMTPPLTSGFCGKPASCSESRKS